MTTMTMAMPAALRRSHNPYGVMPHCAADGASPLHGAHDGINHAACAGSNHGAFVNGAYAGFHFVPVAAPAVSMRPPLPPPSAAPGSPGTASLFVGGIPVNCEPALLQALLTAVAGGDAPVALLSFDLLPNKKRSQANSGAARITVSAADAEALLAAFAPFSALVDVDGVWVARTAQQRALMERFVALRRTPGLGHINLFPMHCMTVERSQTQRRPEVVR